MKEANPKLLEEGVIQKEIKPAVMVQWVFNTLLSNQNYTLGEDWNYLLEQLEDNVKFDGLKLKFHVKKDDIEYFNQINSTDTDLKWLIRNGFKIDVINQLRLRVDDLVDSNLVWSTLKNAELLVHEDTSQFWSKHKVLEQILYS